LRGTDFYRFAVAGIIRGRPFFVANVIAVGIGVLLVVVMVSLATGVWRYSNSLMRDETPALLIEVSRGASGPDSLFSAAEASEIARLPGVVRTIPLVQGVFGELQSKAGKTLVSLWSSIGEEDPELQRLDYRGGSLAKLSSSGNWLVIPRSVSDEIRLGEQKGIGSELELVFSRRLMGNQEQLVVPVKVAAVCEKSRFSKSFAPLEVMVKIAAWQRHERPALDVPGTPDPVRERKEKRYDNLLLYAHSFRDVDIVRGKLSEMGFTTSSILDTVRKYREIAAAIGAILGTLGGVSLLTGSISIFNSSYAAVLRRLKEFAIYKSYGATGVVLQFIVLGEAVVTATTAGLLGFAGGAGICAGLQRLVSRSGGTVLFPLRSVSWQVSSQRERRRA
jgi:hypothetical protein